MEQWPGGHSCKGGQGTPCLYLIQVPTLQFSAFPAAARSSNGLFGVAGETLHGPLRRPPLSHHWSLLPLVQPHLHSSLCRTILPPHLPAQMASGVPPLWSSPLTLLLYQFLALSVTRQLLPHRSAATTGLQRPCGQDLSVPAHCMLPGSLSTRPDS